MKKIAGIVVTVLMLAGGVNLICREILPGRAALVPAGSEDSRLMPKYKNNRSTELINKPAGVKSKYSGCDGNCAECRLCCSKF
ncbi:MAG: hypothetical protein ABIH24_05145 [Verrucomicrobiota bacterium]